MMSLKSVACPIWGNHSRYQFIAVSVVRLPNADAESCVLNRVVAFILSGVFVLDWEIGNRKNVVVATQAKMPSAPLAGRLKHAALFCYGYFECLRWYQQ